MDNQTRPRTGRAVLWLAVVMPPALALLGVMASSGLNSKMRTLFMLLAAFVGATYFALPWSVANSRSRKHGIVTAVCIAALICLGWFVLGVWLLYPLVRH